MCLEACRSLMLPLHGNINETLRSDERLIVTKRSDDCVVMISIKGF